MPPPAIEGLLGGRWRGDLISLSKREAEGFGTGVEELDLKPAVADRSRLTDQLIHPLLHNPDASVRVDIGSRGWARALTIEQYPKPHGHALSHRSHHEVHVTRVKLIRDPPTKTVKRARVGPDGPIPSESPMVEPKARRRRESVRFVPRRPVAARVEPSCLVIAGIRLRRPEVLPIGLNLVAVRFDRSQPGP